MLFGQQCIHLCNDSDAYNVGGDKEEISHTCSEFPHYLIHLHGSWSFCFFPNGSGMPFLEKDVLCNILSRNALSVQKHEGERNNWKWGKVRRKIPTESKGLALSWSSRNAHMLPSFVTNLDGAYFLFWMRIQRNLENAFLTRHKE